METTFYDENNLSVKKMKSTMKLDFDTIQHKIEDEIFLNTPEFASFMVATPEVERMLNLTQSSAILTSSTPNGQVLFPKHVTEEQEAYAKGFLEALGALHKQESSTNQIVTVIPPAHSQNKTLNLKDQSNFNTQLSQPLTYTNLRNRVNYPTVVSTYKDDDRNSPFISTTVKSEPPCGGSYQLVPQNSPQMATSSMIPINMDEQERAKLERKRERNRQAATRCRNRKLERIDRLEEKVRILKEQNSGLLKNQDLLRSQVDNLKRVIADHTKNGCQVMLTHPML